ncbi:MAG: hypothetical protein ACD_46C00538G0002 [uncultured bacterium]|nr:MAG: hypothetical protein ACD_46C00538G0002 [uncultured bacterium]
METRKINFNDVEAVMTRIKRIMINVTAVDENEYHDLIVGLSCSNLTSKQILSCLMWHFNGDDTIGHRLMHLQSHTRTRTINFYLSLLATVANDGYADSVCELLQLVDGYYASIGMLIAKNQTETITLNYINLLNQLVNTNVAQIKALLKIRQATRNHRRFLADGSIDSFGSYVVMQKNEKLLLAYLKLLVKIKENNIDINDLLCDGPKLFRHDENLYQLIAENVNTPAVIYFIMKNFANSDGYFVATLNNFANRVAAKKEAVFEYIKYLPLEEKIDALIKATSDKNHPLHQLLTTPRGVNFCTPEKGVWKLMRDELELTLKELERLNEKVKKMADDVIRKNIDVLKMVPPVLPSIISYPNLSSTSQVAMQLNPPISSMLKEETKPLISFEDNRPVQPIQTALRPDIAELMSLTVADKQLEIKPVNEPSVSKHTSTMYGKFLRVHERQVESDDKKTVQFQRWASI